MDEPGWITFGTAADGIRKYFDCGWAEARVRLRNGLADGMIASKKAPYDPDQLPRELWTDVAHRDWRDREVDEDGPDEEGCRVEVMVSEDDFRRWLNSQAQPSADSRRDAAIRKLLEAGPRPPWKEFCNKVRNIADGCINGNPALGFSNKSIQRAVKEIESTISKSPKPWLEKRMS